MSRVVPPSGERVGPTKRRPLTDARKLRIHTFQEGRCAECGDLVALSGPSVVYDHQIPVWMGGDDDDGPNMRAICKSPCDQNKTPVDQGDIAKTKRIIARLDGTRRPRKPIPSRPFGKGNKRSWPTRKFPT